VATFPNPNGLLRPGQYAHVRAVVDTQKGALLVPQRALSELQGGYQAAVIDPENHVHIVNVVPGSQVGGMVVALSGFHAGDRLVADGIQKVRDGATVNPLPAAEPGK
jgi:membrane fusion protein (multidrug efflux system)